ncbi:MAG: sigma-70 family RNA polymerase sigma factor [Armatimonadetes bacterium]|nr:sigma-70 family RNA polymerase sigma factor [Armatimonadota bacterium]
MEVGEDEYDRDIPDDSGAPDQLTEQREVREIVRQAVDELPDKLRDVVILYELQGESYEDIASILNVPLGTVKSRLFNARGQLKKKLQRMVEAGDLHVGP